MTAMTPDESHALTTLTVTLHDSREALGRIVSALRPVPVRELTYAVRAPARATAEVVVASADAARARRRLHRVVAVLTVVESDSNPAHVLSPAPVG